MPAESRVVPPGTRASHFTLDATAGGKVSLSDYRGLKNVVLVFLRGFA